MARNTITTPRCPTLAEVTREVEQDPSNYFRDVDGIPFPFRITTLVSGQVAAETILDRVVPETDFEPGAFLPVGTASDL